VALDYLTGQVVWVGKDRKARTLKKFFAAMTKEQKQELEAIVMDMWDPYVLAMSKLSSICFMSLPNSAESSTKELKISYWIAWTLFQKIRRAMAEQDRRYKLKGIVELYDTYWGR
jgi:transposase